MILTNIFQSTLPARGATAPSPDPNNYKQFQSTLPARGATEREGRILQHFLISIHAPRTGSDLCTEILHGDKAISIHAPRTGSDGQLATELGNVEAISIHAPRTGSDLID